MKLPKSMIITFALLAIVNLADIITTIMVFSKHSQIAADLEINPLFMVGIPMWVLYLIKIGSIFLIIWGLSRGYYFLWPHIRYCVVYSLVILIVLFGFVSYSNFMVYQLPTKEIQPLPEEQKAEVLVNEVVDMQIVTRNTPQIPLAYSMFFWSFVVFALWYDWEKGARWRE